MIQKRFSVQNKKHERHIYFLRLLQVNINQT